MDRMIGTYNTSYSLGNLFVKFSFQQLGVHVRGDWIARKTRMYLYYNEEISRDKGNGRVERG